MFHPSEMKKLIMINGPMGIGKTTVCRCLKEYLRPCFFLDGDWCWEMAPFDVSEENKRMVIRNIIFLLNSFLKNSSGTYVLFAWVMPQEEIFEQILNGLEPDDFECVKISLICAPDILKQRLSEEIANGIRKPDIIQKSLAYLPLYENMNTLKIDTSGLAVSQTAEKIVQIIRNK